MVTFRHSGLSGDAVYAARSIKEFTNPHLLLDCSNGYLTENSANQLAELFETQNIKTSVIHNYSGAGFDLDLFRNNPNLYKQHLIISHWQTINAHDTLNFEKAWFDIEPLHIAKIVINRSLRRHNLFFNWMQLKPYKDRCVFIGFEDEHKNFCNKYFQLDYYKCSSLVEVAQVINGCEIFAGNQSFCFAVAEALKKPRILEVSEKENHCTPCGGIFATDAAAIDKLWFLELSRKS